MGKHHLLFENKELMEEWDWDANNMSGLNPHLLYVSSSEKVNWICKKCNAHWKTNIRSRALDHSQCPECAKKVRQESRQKTLVKKKGSIADTNLINEWCYEKNDKLGLNPNKITKGSSKKVWWVCSKCGNEWEAKISNRSINKRGCPYCSNQCIKPGFNDLATTDPELIKEWDFDKNDVKPTEISRGNNSKVWWKCPQGHSYEATVLHRTNGKTNCPFCNSGRQTSFVEQAVFFYVKKIFPDAINRYKEIFNNGMELDIYIPSWKTAIEYDGCYWHEKNKAKRCEKKKFQICKSNNIRLIRIKEGVEFEIVSPSEADKTFYIKNSADRRELESLIDFILHDLTKFIAKKSFVYRSFDVNIDRDEFEIRKYMNNLKNGSLKDLYPEIADEWCYERNGGLRPEQFKPKSSDKVWWKCQKCGHIYKTTICHRTSGTGCPKCFRLKNVGGNHPEAKKIYQYSLEGKFIKVFDSIMDASCECGIKSSSNITMCAKHQRPKAGGFRWEYSFSENIGPLPKKEKKSRIGINGKPVFQLDENGNVIAKYSSMKEAGKILGFHSSNLSKVKKGEIKTCNGYRWKFDE